MMKKLFSFRRLRKTSYDEDDNADDSEEFVQIDANAGVDAKGGKVVVRSFTLEDFSDIKGVLDVLREGMTICLVNIRPLKEKDLVELKRAINKLKKTTEAVEGDIAGFGDDYLVLTPSFATIYRAAGEGELPADEEEK